VAWAALIVFGLFMLLLVYGIAILVFRNAYGIELPSPFDLLPEHWRRRLPHSK
jgi:hypothetical protein